MSKQEQHKAAMDQLFSGLTAPAPSQTPQQQTNEEETTSSTSRQKKYNSENERVCTIVNVELMNKARYIAGKEGLNIRDIFEVGLKFVVKDYEERNGPIHTRKTKAKKGDVSKVFSI